MKKLILIIILLTSLAYPQAVKSVLTQAQKDSIGAMIRDSLQNANLTNYVDKTSTQTITGQKNFSGTVKLGDDASWSFEKNTVNQLVKTIPNTSTRYRYLRFPINDGGWHDEFALQFFATPQNATVAPNYVMSLGYNPNQTKTSRAQWVLNWESYWQPSQDTTDRWSEWYLQYSQPVTQTSIRPISAVTSWKTNYTQTGLAGDRIIFNDRNTLKNVIDYSSNGSIVGFSANKKVMLFGGNGASNENNIQYRFNLPQDSSAWFFNNAEYFKITNNVMGNNALSINPGQRRGIIINSTTNKYPYGGINIYASNYSGKSQGVIYSSQSLDVLSPYFGVKDTTGAGVFLIRNDGTKNVTLGSSYGNGTYPIYAGAYYTGTTLGYLTSALGSLTASGLYVAESSGGSPTRQLYYRTLTINGVTIKVLTMETP